MNKIVSDFDSLLISEILFGVVVFVSILLLIAFYKSKNGKLRKLMIGLFGAKIFLYGGSMIYFVLQYNNIWLWLRPELFRIIIVIPMVINMLEMYYYLRVGILKNNNGKLHKND